MQSHGSKRTPEGRLFLFSFYFELFGENVCEVHDGDAVLLVVAPR